MVGPAAPPQPAPHSALRRLVVRHPVAAFLTMAYAVTSMIAGVVLWTHRDIHLPLDLPLSGAFDHLVGGPCRPSS